MCWFSQRKWVPGMFRKTFRADGEDKLAVDTSPSVLLLVRELNSLGEMMSPIVHFLLQLIAPPRMVDATVERHSF
jgi:hypothetical protein